MSLAAVLALTGTTRAAAQAASLATFSQAQGLGSLEDNCLLQDHRGFVYTCTENGLFRFDGHVFQRLGLSSGLRSNFIAALHEDASARLWVGTRTDLYVGDGEHFEAVVAQGHALPIDPGAMLADLDGRLYAVSQHRLWVVERTAKGWHARPRFDPAALAKNAALGDVTSVFADKGSLWFGCGKSLCQVTGETLRMWGDRDGIPADTWTSYLRTRDGTLWARSPLHIRALLPGSTTFISHDIPGAHVVTAYLDMIEDAQGRLLTRADDGLARWDGDDWQIFDDRNGLPKIGIDALLYDRSHVLWIGTYGHGILQWRGYDQIQSWQTGQGLDSSPSWAMARAKDGSLWVGDELGGSMLAPGAKRLAPWPLKPPPLAQETTSLLALPNGDMLTTYYSGELVRYRASDGVSEHVAQSPAYIRNMFIDSHGLAWLCTERGLYVYDGHQLKRAGDGVLPDNMFNDGKEDAQGRLWFTSDVGLFRLDRGRWSRVRVTGAPSNQDFSHIDVLGGDLYVSGTFAGLWRGSTSDADAVALQHVGDNLLDDTRIYFVRHDRRGWLWIGGTDGVEVFDGQHWRRLTEDDGLIWDDIAENAFFEDADGSIWIGTSNGISHILNPASLMASRPLDVVISEVSLADVLQPSASSYRFDYSPEQPLSLRLATLGVPTRSTLQYRYRLQGLEREWVNSDRPQIDYPPLPPGDYVFQVRVYNPDSRQLSPIVALPLRIVPPWWQRWPAIIAGLLLCLVGIVFAWHLRTRRLRARARALEKLVLLRTHELEVDKQALEDARAALWQQANHDALTGLPNRSRVLEILSRAIDDARQNGESLAIALIDLDHFKRINDQHGHLAGDAVLIEVAARLCETLPAGATVGRYGGEELLAVVPRSVMDDVTAYEVLRQKIARGAFRGDSVPVSVTCSIGVAWLRNQDDDGFDLIRRADAALYEAKTAGRNRVVMAASARREMI